MRKPNITPALLAEVLVALLAMALRVLQEFLREGRVPVHATPAQSDETAASRSSLIYADPSNGVTSRLGGSPYPSEQHIRDVLQRMRAGDYRSNDIVEIIGPLTREGEHSLRINAMPKITLQYDEYLVALELAQYAKETEPELAAPGGPERTYLHTDQFLQRFEKLRLRLGVPEQVWPLAAKDSIHDAMHRLRKKIRRAGGHPGLIRSIRNVGYRFDTLPENLLPVFVPAQFSAGPGAPEAPAP